MIKMEIDQASLNRTIRDLDKLSDKKHEDAFRIVARSAWNISSKAKNDCPYKTGRLKGSIHAEHKDNANWNYSTEDGSFDGSLKESFLGNLGHNIGSNVDYAEFVHDGTSKVKGRPFLSVHFYQEKTKMLRRLKKLVTEKWN